MMKSKKMRKKIMRKKKMMRKKKKQMIEEVKKGFKNVTLGGSITDLKAGKGFASAGTMDAKKRDALLADIATQDDVHDTLSKNMNTLFNK